MLLKLVALLVGLGGAVAVADAADWDIRNAFKDPAAAASRSRFTSSPSGVYLRSPLVQNVGAVPCPPRRSAPRVRGNRGRRARKTVPGRRAR